MICKFLKSSRQQLLTNKFSLYKNTKASKKLRMEFKHRHRKSTATCRATARHKSAGVKKRNLFLNSSNRLFYDLVLATFLLLFTANAYGLIPYTLATAEQRVFMLIIALNIFLVCSIVPPIKKHKIKFFQRFFPDNLHSFLGPLLIFIEVISFFFGPISLAVRLLANIMAGYILILVFGGFIGFIIGFGEIIVCLLGVDTCISIVLGLIILNILATRVTLTETPIFLLCICIFIIYLL